MNRDEFIDLWCNALESGDYQQGRNYLHTDTGYCCLGVACDLAVKHGVVDLAVGHVGTATTYDGDTGRLPGKMCDFLGMTGSGDYSSSSLAIDNDADTTFDQIAATIRARPEGLIR